MYSDWKQNIQDKTNTFYHFFTKGLILQSDTAHIFILKMNSIYLKLKNIKIRPQIIKINSQMQFDVELLNFGISKSPSPIMFIIYFKLKKRHKIKIQ